MSEIQSSTDGCANKGEVCLSSKRRGGPFVGFGVRKSRYSLLRFRASTCVLSRGRKHTCIRNVVYKNNAHSRRFQKVYLCARVLRYLRSNKNSGRLRLYVISNITIIEKKIDREKDPRKKLRNFRWKYILEEKVEY